jgi:hypothetical protein
MGVVKDAEDDKYLDGGGKRRLACKQKFSDYTP